MFRPSTRDVCLTPWQQRLILFRNNCPGILLASRDLSALSLTADFSQFWQSGRGRGGRQSVPNIRRALLPPSRHPGPDSHPAPSSSYPVRSLDWESTLLTPLAATRGCTLLGLSSAPSPDLPSPQGRPPRGRIVCHWPARRLGTEQ